MVAVYLHTQGTQVGISLSQQPVAHESIVLGGTGDNPARTFHLLLKPRPVWDFSLGLWALMNPPLKPLAASFICLWRWPFWLLSPLPQEQLSLGPLWQTPPYTVFQKEKVSVTLPSPPPPIFIPKVPSECHMIQVIHLPLFCPKYHATREGKKLHSLDVHQALAFYWLRTKPFKKSARLCFLCWTDKMGSSLLTESLQIDFRSHPVLLCVDDTSPTRCESPLD